MRQVWITTADNPFDPFEDFDSWNAFDQEKGYNTTQYVARVAVCAEELGDEAILMGAEEAINSIVIMYPDRIYRKVVKNGEEGSNKAENGGQPEL